MENDQVSPLSFGIISDLQFCNGDPYKNRYFKNSIQKLEKAVKELNQHSIDFIINLGDTIDRDFESFDEILPHFKRFNSPVYQVLGNHDYEVEDQFKHQVHKKIGTSKYYEFTMKNWRFIVLDGNEISTFANVEGIENFNKAKRWLERMEGDMKVNGNFWNGGIGEKQLVWFEKILQKATKNHEKAVVFCHYPVWPVDRHNLLNDDVLLQVIGSNSCVKAWFSGHNHDGNYGQYSHVHFVNMKGMVETERDLVFSMVSLYDDYVLIKGFGNEISAKLAI